MPPRAPTPKPGLLFVFGVFAPLWWTWLASQATYRLYLLGGSPVHPSEALLWWSVFVPSLLIGLGAGLIATLLYRAAPLKGWALFCGSLLLGAVIEALLTRTAILGLLAALFASYGNVVFWIGTLVWPATASVRRRV